MYFNLLFLMAAPDGKAQGSGVVNLVILALAMFVFYFLMIRPRNKQIKKQREFLSKLERGLRIVTTTGIHGKISRLNDDNTIDVEISPGTYVKMEKSAISLELTEQAQKNPLATQVRENSKEDANKRHRHNNYRDRQGHKSEHNKSENRGHSRNNRRENNKPNEPKANENKPKSENSTPLAQAESEK